MHALGSSLASVSGTTTTTREPKNGPRRYRQPSCDDGGKRTVNPTKWRVHEHQGGGKNSPEQLIREEKDRGSPETRAMGGAVSSMRR